MPSSLAFPGALAAGALLLAASIGLGGCSAAPGNDLNGAPSTTTQDDAGGGSSNGGSNGQPSAGGSGGGSSTNPGAGGGSVGAGATDDAGTGGATDDASGASEAGGGSSNDAGGGSDGDAAPAKTPGWNLSGWRLQLPIGATDDPTMIDNPTGFSDAYFYIDTDGALAFMDPRTGVTTSGSKHCRSELAEDTSGWSASGTNVMTATVSVPLVPQTVTIGQIFQSPSAPSKPLLELQYVAGGKLQVLLESTNQGGSSTSPQVGTVTDGAKFDYAIALSNNAIAITINGKTTNLTVPSSFAGEKFYFKWGDYDQTAAAGAESTTPGTIVKFYAHAVTHS